VGTSRTCRWLRPSGCHTCRRRRRWAPGRWGSASKFVSTPRLQAEFARALAFQRETITLVADDVTPISEGWLIRTPSLPLVWALNQVRIAGAIEFDDAVSLTGRHQRELPYRQLMVESDETGARMEDRFRASRWRVDCEVTMVLVSGPDRRVQTDAVFEPSAEPVLELLRRWNAEDQSHAPTAEEQDQLSEYWQQEFRARDARLLGVRGRSGALAAVTMLYSDGETAQVENVYTAPEERGQGFARALVSRAVELGAEGGHELTFIVADDYDWPKLLYARLGFEPVGRTWAFHG
jgi:GNAT superfamily N-acetyltransferase